MELDTRNGEYGASCCSTAVLWPGPHCLPVLSQGGYTYLLVLFFVAGLGLFVAQAGVVWQHVMQREREADLLAIGKEFSHALTSYRQASPGGALPESLTQLVEDKRGPILRRHLRRIYRDPFTGKADWGVVRAGGGIVGIFSLAPGIPVRRHDLPPELGAEANNAKNYAQWVFGEIRDDGLAPNSSAAQKGP